MVEAGGFSEHSDLRRKMQVIAGLLASFATKKLDVLRKQMRIQSLSEAP